MVKKCLAPTNVVTTTLLIKQCPQCGSEVEFFSDELQVRCSICGTVVRK